MLVLYVEGVVAIHDVLPPEQGWMSELGSALRASWMAAAGCTFSAIKKGRSEQTLVSPNDVRSRALWLARAEFFLRCPNLTTFFSSIFQADCSTP